MPPRPGFVCTAELVKSQGQKHDRCSDGLDLKTGNMFSSDDLEYVGSPDRDASASGGGGAPFCQVFHTILRLGTTVYGTQTPCTPHVPNANTSPDSDQYLIGSYARPILALTATAVFPLSLSQRTVLFAPATDTDGRAQATLNNIDRGDLDRPGTAWSTET